MDLLKPFKALADKVEEIQSSIEQRARIAALQELAVIILSRLVTLNPKEATRYQLAIGKINDIQ